MPRYWTVVTRCPALACSSCSADGTIFSNLSLTGAYLGIYADGVSNSDGVTLNNLSVYGNANSGVFLSNGNDGLTVTGGEYFDNNGIGLRTNNIAGTTVTDALFYNSETPIYTQGIGL